METILKLKKEKEDWLFLANGLPQEHQESLKNDLIRKADNIQWQIDEIERAKAKSPIEPKATLPIVRHSTCRLSKCCGKGVSKTNTTNDIICWKCNECGNLTAVVDENGNRLN